jgi:hypothetical protein
MTGVGVAYLSAEGSTTATYEFHLPANNYVMAQCALNMFVNTTGSSAINIVSYTASNGKTTNFAYPNQPGSIWGSGILNVTFALYAYGSFSTGVASVFLS